MPFSGVRISWLTHREEAALRAVRGFRLAQFPVAVGEFLDPLLRALEFCAESAVAPREQRQRAARRDNQRARDRGRDRRIEPAQTRFGREQRKRQIERQHHGRDARRDSAHARWPKTARARTSPALSDEAIDAGLLSRRGI